MELAVALAVIGRHACVVGVVRDRPRLSGGLRDGATGLAGLVFAGVYLAAGRKLAAPMVAHGSLDTTGFMMIYFGVYPGL